jgi:hypothetical protein
MSILEPHRYFRTPSLNKTNMRKKSLFIFCFLLSLSTFSFANPSKSAAVNEGAAGGLNNEIRMRLAEEGFLKLYNSIDFGKGTKPAYEVFRRAFIGYLNLLKEQKLSNTKILTCIDFSLPSVQKRLWVIDLVAKKVLFHDLVAHGKNSGGNLAKTFSNISNSHMSSLGFYVTAHKYYGKHGLSLRLSGQEAGFNDKAMERAVVIHGADYVNPEICRSLGRLGRSFGCPALSRLISDQVINTIADGSCLFIYYPDADYLANSRMLNELPAIDYFLSLADL